jgi:hypothetical protein
MLPMILLKTSLLAYNNFIDAVDTLDRENKT